MQEEQNKSEVTEQKEMRQPIKKKSGLRCFLYFLCLLLILLFALFGFLATGKGQRTTLNFVSHLLNGLEIEQSEGSLQDGLTLKNTLYEIDGVSVKVGQADLKIGFKCLLNYNACIENISLKDTKVVVDTAKLPVSDNKEKKPVDLENFSLPIDVSLQNLTLENVQVRIDEMDIGLNYFSTGIQGKNKDITIAPTKLDGLFLSLAPEAVENTKDKAKDKAKEAVKSTDWKNLKQTLSEPLLNRLESVKLPLYFDVPDFKAHDIRIEQKKRNDDGNYTAPIGVINVPVVAIQAKSDKQKIELKDFEIQSDKGNVSGQGEITMAGNYPLKWSLKGSHPEFVELKIPASFADIKIDGELFGQTNLSLQSSGAAEFNLDGVVSLAEPKTPFNLSLKSDQISYPFIPEKGSDPLKLKDIDLILSGDLLDYRLKGKVNNSGMNLPSGNLQIDGKGDITHFALNELILTALEGKTTLNGKVDWSEGVEWNTAVKLNSVNTKSLLPEWAAVLSGDLETSGYAARGEQGKDWAVAVKNMNVEGMLFQKKLHLKGNLTSDSQTLLNVQQANLIYGENVITLNGILGDKSDFSADINAPNLKGLIPKLSASLKGKVKMQGKITEPGLDLDLKADNLAYDNLILQGLSAKGKISTEKQISADLNIALNKYSQGDIRLENVVLAVQGTESNHTLKLSSKGEPVGANLQISGKFDRNNQNWQGQLSNVAIQSPLGLFQNDKAVQVSYNNKQVSANISAHCWRNPTLNFCFPQAFNAGEEGKIPFEIHKFDLSNLQEYLDKTTQLAGIVNIKGDAAWFKNKAPLVNLELVSNHLKLNQKLETGSFPLAFSPLKITAKLAENNLNMNTDIQVENNGRISSNLLMKDITGKRALSGNINIDRLTLALLKPLLGGGESINGDINARLTLGGNALSPLLYGNLNLTGLNAKSNAMPFDIVGGGLTMTFNGATSTLKGNIKTPESQLLLDGDANWQKLDAWHTRIRANANKFRVDVPGIAKVDVSPNIEVKVTPKELVLGGQVDIPWARIEVQELPESAVSVSGDEVIMDGSAKNKKAFKLPSSGKNAPQNGQGMAIKGDVSINIGNDVRLEAYGLKTNLNGTIKVRQGNKGLGLYGQVNLKNGTFASFGQDLVIRKGLISFTGLPSQPTLDIEAIRNPDAMEDSSVTAGVKVTGIADDLEVKVFSNPSMSQNEALSYILTGRGLESSADAASNNSIAAALIGMSLSKGGKTVGKVGSAFGINDLNVSTEGIGDNTKVVLSGSLTPKFRVKYGVGIFAPLTELTLRYRLAPSLYLQWVSSLNQAVDLLYRFEF